MNEELLRTWARDHSILIDSVVAAGVILTVAVQILRWIRTTDFPKAKAELRESLHADPAAGAVATPLNRRTARLATFALLALGLIVLGVAALFSWNEYLWIGAEVARARYVTVTRNPGMLTASYQVQPLNRPPFVATFSFTPRFDHWAEAADAMRADRVVDIHPGDPLRYREHRPSSGKDPGGWDLIRLIVALGACFGGVLLFGAFAAHRAATTA